jgi:GT2 family glycosyltransferase
MSPNYTITFACYNQLDYTQQFIASLDRAEVDFSRIVAVDNGSTDGTREWLQQQGFGAVILMNNDVICAEGWLRNLILAADAHQLHIASPAMVEGELNYDFVHWAKEAEVSMRGYVRHGAPHAVCMAIRDDVWNDIGYFMPVPKLLGYEDGIFFQRAAEAGLKTGTTADSWLHHYGMTTQKALKLEMKLDQRDSLGSRNLMRLYMAQSWLTRKFSRHQRRRLVKAASAHELATFGKTVHGINTNLGKDWGWV